MKRLLAMSCTAIVLANAAPVFAQEAPVAEPTASMPTSAPAAEAPSVPTSEPAKGRRLSHINGVPVKVGEHTDYYYDAHEFHPWNLAINPMGLIVGMYGASVSYALSDRVALRAEITIYRVVDSNVTGTEFDLGVPIYFRKMYSGFFVEPGFMHREMGQDDYGYNTEAGPQVLVGWHWTWDSGFNLMLAAGMGRDLTEEQDEYGGGNSVFANGYFKIGKTF